MPEPVRLLVVSDSDLYAARIVGALEAKGLSASTERVASPDAMRGALLRGPRDAVVSDLGVTGLDAERLVGIAREGGRGLPVIVVSGEKDGEQVNRALRAGVDEFIPLKKLPCIVCSLERIVREAAVRSERLVTENSLREKDDLLHTIVANAPVVLFATDAEGTVTLFEGKGIEVFGVELRDIVGRNVFRDFAGKCPMLAENCRRALAGEELSRLVESPAGLFLDTRCRPLRNEEGDISGVICVATDVTERERTRQALAESEARYRALVENTNDIVVAFDTGGRITYVSPQVERLGYIASEVISGSIFDFVHEEDRERTGADFRRTIVTGEEFPTEFRMRDAEGQVRWFEEIGKVQRDEAGRITGIIGILRDTTDRKRAEEELRKARDELERRVEERTAELHTINDDLRREIEERKAVEERLRLTEASIDQSTDPTFWIGSDASFLRVNDAACEALGYSRDELLSMTVHDIDPLYARDVWPEHWADFLEQGSLTFESVHRAKDGREFPVEVSVTRVEFGGEDMMFAYVHDITERKLAVDTLRLSEEKFRQFFENEPEYCYMVSPEGLFLDLNRAALDAFGYARDELVGKSVETIYPPESLQRMREIFEKWRETGSVRDEEIVIATKTGERRTVLLSSAAVRNGEGRIRHSVSVQRDITDRKRAQEKVIEQNAFLTQVLESLTHPFYVIDAGNYKIVLANSAARLGPLTDATTCHELTHGSAEPCRAPEHFCPLEEVKRTGSPVTVEHTHVDAEGRERIFEIHAYPILDDRGEVKRMIEYNIDITERKAAEEEIASLARFPSENPNPIMRLDRDGTIIYANEASKAVLAEWGTSVGDHAPDHWRTVVAESMRSGTQKTEELHCCGCVYLAVVAPVAKADYANFYASDITERKLGEESLRQSEERYALAQKASGIGSWDWDVRANVVHWSEELQHIFGLGPGEFGGGYEGFLDRVQQEDRGEVKKAIRDCLDCLCEEYVVEHRIVRPDGETRWLYGRGTALADDRGEPVRLIGVAMDITERKRAEEELREARDQLERRVEERTSELAEANLRLRRSEETYRSLVTDLPDAVTVTGPDGIIRYVSGHRADLHGVGSVEEMLGLKTVDLVVPEDRARYEASLRQVFETGAAQAAEFSILREDGSTFIAEESFGVLRDADGRANSVVTVVRDVTGRKELERRLIESQRLEAVGRLAGGLAHDFNNLLTAIGGFASRILKKVRPETPIHADATQIRKASDMAASLTSQLLAFSRRQIMQPVVLTLNEVLDDVEMMLRRLIGEDIELVIRPEPSPGLTLADPGQIGQVIVNLAVNARDAMPYGGVLTIETADLTFAPPEASGHPGVPPGAYVTVSVTDTGAGIPPDVLPHIFEPFYTTKEKGKGTGLGLSTVYGIVTQSGGHVRVSSEVGRGSCFVIYLPRIVAGREEGPATPPATGAVSLEGNETILLVEDEDSVRDLTSLTLADYGYSVLEASNGDDAIAIAARHEGPIHLLLTDVVMPRMSGREVATRIVAARPDTKVVFMSGYTDNVEVRGAGASDAPLMTKPFNEEDLALMVREVLDSTREWPKAS